MITTRSITPKPTSLKYNYKTSTASTRPFGQDSTAKKDSRVKNRNTQKTQHTTSYHGTLNKEWREPLGQKKNENLEKCLDLADYHKKESMVLKKKNEMLQVKIKDQSSEIQQLKMEVANIKKAVSEKMDYQIREERDLIEANQGLEEKFKNQQNEITFLKQTILTLNDTKGNDLTFGDTYGNIDLDKVGDPNEVSRRKEIMKQYEVFFEDIKNSTICQRCKDSESAEQVKEKYSNQLRELQEEVGYLREKELMVEVLEKQVANKNDCIDYLTKQLSTFQQNSVHLLNIIQVLEQKLQRNQPINLPFQPHRQRKGSFNGLSDYKY